jgi:hypothetical protein
MGILVKGQCQQNRRGYQQQCLEVHLSRITLFDQK